MKDRNINLTENTLNNLKDNTESVKVFVFAGEFSGDVHGSNLVKELKDKFESEGKKVLLYGTGGDGLKSLGQQQFYHINEMSIIGFTAVIKSFSKILKMLRKMKEAILNINPDIVILVDYPGFNLRLAESIKDFKGLKIYYIAPQFWVWAKGRVYKLRDYIDKVISIFPFEEEVLKRYKVNSVYVGNPIIDNIKYKYESKEEFFNNLGLDKNKKVISIFPGSRKFELTSTIPTFLKAADKIKDEYQFVISKSTLFTDEEFSKVLEGYDIKVLTNKQYDMMKYCDIAWACSGTVSLEIALHLKPMLITYNSHSINIYVARLISIVKDIGLPNIIAGKIIVPELMGKDFTVKKILKSNKYLEENKEEIVKELAKVSAQFFNKTPSKSAVKEIFSLYNAKVGKK